MNTSLQHLNDDATTPVLIGEGFAKLAAQASPEATRWLALGAVAGSVLFTLAWGIRIAPSSPISKGISGLRTVDNDTAVWRGISVGRYSDGTERSLTYRGALTVENAVGVLSELNGVLAVFELEIDDNDKVHHRVWTLTAEEPTAAPS